MFASQRVTFRNPQSGHTITTLVAIYPASRDIQKNPDAVGYHWAVTWPASLTYAEDGRPITENHEIIWPHIQAVRNAATLRSVTRSFGPMARATAYFEEVR